MSDSTPELEEFMVRSRQRRSIKMLQRKLERAEVRKSKNVLVPIDVLRTILKDARYNL